MKYHWHVVFAEPDLQNEEISELLIDFGTTYIELNAFNFVQNRFSKVLHTVLWTKVAPAMGNHDCLSGL